MELECLTNYILSILKRLTNALFHPIHLHYQLVSTLGQYGRRRLPTVVFIDMRITFMPKLLFLHNAIACGCYYI